MIGWAMIGCGSVTEVKSGPGLYKAERSTLVGVYNRTQSRAEDWVARHKAGKVYASLEELLGDPAVDIVYIATPPDSHLFYTQACAEAGKAVYCEKPMARSYGEALQMVDLCKEHQVPLYSAYYRRGLSKFHQIKALLDEGAIGAVQSVSILMQKEVSAEERSESPPWRIDPAISGGGHFHDIGSHALDLIDWFFGPITYAQGFGANRGGYYAADDQVVGHFQIEGGISGTGRWLFNTHSTLDVTTIYGELGKISYSVLALDEPIVVETKQGKEVLVTDPVPLHVAQPLIQLIVDELLGIGEAPSTGASAARTDWVLERLSAPLQK